MEFASGSKSVCGRKALSFTHAKFMGFGAIGPIFGETKMHTALKLCRASGADFSQPRPTGKLLYYGETRDVILFRMLNKRVVICENKDNRRLNPLHALKKRVAVFF